MRRRRRSGCSAAAGAAASGRTRRSGRAGARGAAAAALRPAGERAAGWRPAPRRISLSAVQRRAHCAPGCHKALRMACCNDMQLPARSKWRERARYAARELRQAGRSLFRKRALSRLPLRRHVGPGAAAAGRGRPAAGGCASSQGDRLLGACSAGKGRPGGSTAGAVVRRPCRRRGRGAAPRHAARARRRAGGCCRGEPEQHECAPPSASCPHLRCADAAPRVAQSSAPASWRCPRCSACWALFPQRWCC